MLLTPSMPRMVFSTFSSSPDFSSGMSMWAIRAFNPNAIGSSLNLITDEPFGRLFSICFLS